MKIYTKKGDKGETRLLFGDAVSKDDLAPDAYGSVDELVAALGLIRADKELPIEVQENILRIQRELFIVGAELATTKENRKKLKDFTHLKFLHMFMTLVMKKEVTIHTVIKNLEKTIL